MERTFTLLGWGRDMDPPNWFYNPAYIVNRIYLILGGSVMYKGSIPLKPGRMYLFRADPEFRVNQSAEDPVDHIFFDFLTDRPLLAQDYLELTPGSDERLDSIVKALLAEKLNPALPRESDTGKYYLGLLLHILGDHLLTGVEYSAATASVLRLLHEREPGELSVSKLAEELCLDEDYLIRRFKREVGVTPHRYLAMMKKDRAISYHRQGMNCTEIAERLGFGSLSAFSYFFKKETGSSLSALKGQPGKPDNVS